MKTNYISLALRILIAIIFVQTLYFKFTAHPDSVFIFSQLGAEPYGRITLGIIELFTAILLLLPQTYHIGILLSLGIIIGAIASHIMVLGLNVQGDGGTLFYLAITVMVACCILLYIHYSGIRERVRKLKFFQN